MGMSSMEQPDYHAFRLGSGDGGDEVTIASQQYSFLNRLLGSELHHIHA